MKKFLKVSVFSLLFMSFSGVFAAPPITFKVVPASTTMEWKAKKVTGNHFGLVKVINGDIVIDGTNVKGGSFEVDLTSMTVEDIKDPGTNGKLLGHLKSDDFFSVDKHPTAKFVIASVTPKSGSTYTVKGKLTIKGITQDIEFPADIAFQGSNMTATAKIKVDRTKFDIKYRSSNWFENLGDKAIYDDFELDLKLVAKAG
jgi:polyisoprenoid-binding protein YceI